MGAGPGEPLRARARSAADTVERDALGVVQTVARQFREPGALQFGEPGLSSRGEGQIAHALSIWSASAAPCTFVRTASLKGTLCEILIAQ
jgi:hypothetical protein